MSSTQESLPPRQSFTALSDALTARGLEVRVLSGGTLEVRNRAAEPPEGDRMGRALSPGLRQEVACRRHIGGSLWWFWVWSGMTRSAPAELEPLCPVGGVETAAERIVRVLAVPGESAVV